MKLHFSLFVLLVLLCLGSAAGGKYHGGKYHGSLKNIQSYNSQKSSLSSASACSLSIKLEKFKKWLIEHNKSDSVITAEMETRYQTMVDTTVYSIDTAGVVFVGTPSAPIWIIAYVSLSCPLCKKLHKDLYDSITGGSLAGKVRFGIKPFTVNRLNTALAAIGRWHGQASLLNSLAYVNERVSMERVLLLTDSLKIPRGDFLDSCNSSSMLSYVISSHDEGVRNGVSFTPAFFINGHRYQSYKDAQWVVDAIDFRYLCVTKKHK